MSYAIPMMIQTEINQHLQWLIAQVGKSEARRMLVIEGLSPVTAERVVGGRYPKIGVLVAAAIKSACASLKKAAG